VADFGQTQAMAGTSLVKQGYAVGSPEIIAPERVHGQGPSRHSDYYSLGILCYQMLAGDPPFTGSPAAVLHAQAYEQPRPLHLINPSISVSLSETIERMLSKGLELRYNTGAEFARALAVAIEGTAPIRAPATAATQMKEAGFEANRPFWKRPWLWTVIAIIGIILLLLVGFGVVSLFSLFQPAATPAQLNLQVLPTEAPQATIVTEPTTEVVQPTEVAAVEPAPAIDTPEPPSPTPIPTETPTLVPLPTPGPPTIAAGSPFTNLRLAHNVTADGDPTQTGTSFAPGPQPIYLFFDFKGIEAGTPWAHRWVWGDTELGIFDDTWSENYSSSGTAWIYFSPVGGFQSGPYQVTLEVNGRVVSTATFVVQAGGL
jgi:serine/threonine protein kinase